MMNGKRGMVSLMIKKSTLKRTIQDVLVYANHPAKAGCYSYINIQYYEQKLLSRIIIRWTITKNLFTKDENEFKWGSKLAVKPQTRFI